MFYYLNIISFKCSPLLFKHKRILRTVFFMTFSKFFGPYFFEDVDGTVIVKGDNYRQMTQEYLLPQLEYLNM